MLGRAKELLGRDALENITMLKMIDAYGKRLQCRLVEKEAGWGILISLPTALSAFDLRIYPDAESIILVAGTDLNAIAELVRELPSDRNFVFKVQREAYKNVIAQSIRLNRARAFYTYTCSEPIRYSSCEKVVEGDRLDARNVPLWLANGYSHQELIHLFNAGARSYTIYDRDESAVSTCIVFRNYGRIWEVGAVHTAESDRGKGYAKIVCSAAINSLLDKGLLPRYQVEHHNEPSIRLAKSLGLTLAVTLEHYY